MKLNIIINIDHVSPRKIGYVNKLQNLSSFQQTVPRTIFGYPEAICDKGTSSKPEVSWWSKQAIIIVDFTARQKKSESSGN